MFIESIEWWCRTHTPISLYGRQPGLTHRSTCPSIPGLGQGAPHPKRCLHGLDLSAYPQNHSAHGTHRTHGTISPIQEEYYSYNGMLDYPHIPRLPQINIIVGGVYGVKNRYILGGHLLGRCLSPLTLRHPIFSVALDWGCLHPSISLSSSIPTQSYVVVWFIYNYLLKSCI